VLQTSRRYMHPTLTLAPSPVKLSHPRRFALVTPRHLYYYVRRTLELFSAYSLSPDTTTEQFLAMLKMKHLRARFPVDLCLLL
jgi:hypothetical protein